MENEQNNMIDNLLVKYLLGEAGFSEQTVVQEWIAASPENKQYFEHFRLIWEQSRLLASHSQLDTEAAWDRFKTRVQVQPESLQKPVRTISFMPRTWLRAATLLLLVAGGGWIAFYLNEKSSGQVAINSGDRVVTDTLPDGSIVTLNKGATLSYKRKFAGNTRPVILTGEAFFAITPDKQKPFIIDANGVGVKVVGTSFNVKTTEERTEVIVETGIVEVSKEAHEVQVKPHERAIVIKGNAPQKQSNQDELYNYYRTKEFVCNATPLNRLVDVLREAYGADIVIADARLGDLQLTTTFRNESLDSILAVISETLNIEVVRTGQQIVLKAR